MGLLEEKLRGKSLADYTNTQLRLALGAVLYTNTADMWKKYLNQSGYTGDVSQMLQKYYVDNNVPSQFRNYINAGASIFNPQHLFLSGEQGYVYDLNDSFAEKTAYRRNLLTYSEQLGAAPWSGATYTVTADQIVAPDGTTTADLVTATSAGGQVRQFFVSTAGIRTFSCYVKKGNASVITFKIINIADAFTFNLDTGLVTGGIHAGKSFVENVGNGWYRIGCWLDTGATTNYGPGLGLTSTSDTVYAWGFQMEVGSAVSAYQKVTDWNTELLAAFPQTTVYLDSAGTTAASVNGLVGLVLDKSKGLALGADLVTNGDFSAGSTGWSVFGNDATHIATFSGGELRYQSDTTSPQLSVQQTAISITGGWYEVIASCSSYTSGGVKIFENAGGSGQLNINSAGVFKGLFFCPAGGTLSITRTTTNVDLTLDYVSVRPYAGNHAYQSTTGNKPVLRGSPIGANLVTNGDFASGTAGWTGINATLSNVANRLRVTAVANGQSSASFAIATTAGGVYRITVDFVTDAVTGSTFLYAGTSTGSANLLNVNLLSTPRTAVAYFTAIGTTSYITLASSSGALAAEYNEWDNVEVKDVSAGQVQAPYALQFDGVDDFLQTASVNFTATDKMTVCHGVRKLSDSADGTIAELSASVSVNNSSFNFNAPGSGAVTKFQFATRGTATSVPFTTSATYNAPYTGVITGVSEIGTDTAILRINGTQVDTRATDQGTGNYGNYPLYFGRRGGTTLPYNGLFFSAICVGKTASATELASIERWTNQRTGAY